MLQGLSVLIVGPINVQSFQMLKDRLASAPMLAYADFPLSFILEVDASHGRLGTVLSQEQAGKVRPVAYASRV